VKISRATSICHTTAVNAKLIRREKWKSRLKAGEDRSGESNRWIKNGITSKLWNDFDLRSGIRANSAVTGGPLDDPN
jgi:hypothetical protein